MSLSRDAFASVAKSVSGIGPGVAPCETGRFINVSNQLAPALILAGALISGGCATKNYVKSAVSPVQTQAENNTASIDQNRAAIATWQEKTVAAGERANAAETRANDAMAEASAAKTEASNAQSAAAMAQSFAARSAQETAVLRGQVRQLQASSMRRPSIGTPTGSTAKHSKSVGKPAGKTTKRK